MPESLSDLVARLRATTPALADVPDAVLTAEVARQLQARGGPSVGDALGVPVFRTSNEKDAGGAAVVRADGPGPTVGEALSPWTKAATIGASPADVQRSALRVALGEIQAPARTPGLRAAGWGERAADAEHAAWTWLSRTLPGTVGDALGVTPFRAKAEELEHPPAITVGMLPPPDVGLGTVPDTLGKLVKPFGGTVERLQGSTRPVKAIEQEMDALTASAGDFGPDFTAKFDALEAEKKRALLDPKLRGSWIVRLTPAMKARILKEGLPLSLLLGAAAGPSVAEALGSPVSAHDQE